MGKRRLSFKLKRRSGHFRSRRRCVKGDRQKERTMDFMSFPRTKGLDGNVSTTIEWIKKT